MNFRWTVLSEIRQREALREASAEGSIGASFVTQFAWKDLQDVPFMITVHEGKQTVNRVPRRPATTATNTHMSPVLPEMLQSLSFINVYHHFMSGVSKADQLRSYYTTLRVREQTWRLLKPALRD